MTAECGVAGVDGEFIGCRPYRRGRVDVEERHWPYAAEVSSQEGPAEATAGGVEWVILTMGDRPDPLAAAIRSIGSPTSTLVVLNSSDHRLLDVPPSVEVAAPGKNLGVPGGRDFGLYRTGSELVGFLDDDAVLSAGGEDRILAAFAADPRLAAVSLRLVDEEGDTARRHIPRRGAERADEDGQVATFLGGASVIRRAAYEQVGGYFTDLFYGHEELELSWRLIDAGWSIRYLADVEVVHPRTEISRHAAGWTLTGRNRVWIARRTLPWPIAIVHVTAWLLLGVVRAPAGCRLSYCRGWSRGWLSEWSTGRGDDAKRAPISWDTVRHLRRLGRLPIY